MSLPECGLEGFEAAQPLGGMAALRTKSLALTDLFIALVEQLRQVLETGEWTQPQFNQKHAVT